MKFKTIFLIALILFFNLPHFAFSPPIIDTNLIHKKCSQLLKDENVLRFKEFFESTEDCNTIKNETKYFINRNEFKIFNEITIILELYMSV